jgi:hypothetical protein
LNLRRIVMTASALVLALLGISASFAPQELAGVAGLASTETLAVLIQLTGALYLSMAMANWMARESLIGGIYGRPLAVANVLHFTMGALALSRHLPGATWLVALTAIYAVFALAFGAILFTSPVKGE